MEGEKGDADRFNASDAVKVVGTLRVPLYFFPYWRDFDGIGHCQERHKECAYYFF